MSLFYTKSEKCYTVFSPMSGEIRPLEELPDELISSYAIGNGFSVIPSEGKLLSPIDGKLNNVNDTLDTYRLTSDFGAEVLIKLGTGSQKLLGEGIRSFASPGDTLKRGAAICTFDPELFSENGVSPYSAVVICNTDAYRSMTVFEGACVAGVSEALTFLPA